MIGIEDELLARSYNVVVTWDAPNNVFASKFALMDEGRANSEESASKLEKVGMMTQCLLRARVGKLQTLGRIPPVKKGFCILNSWGGGGGKNLKSKLYEIHIAVSVCKVLLEQGHAHSFTPRFCLLLLYHREVE